MIVPAAPADGTPGLSHSLARGTAGIALAHVVAARERTGPWAQARQSLAAMTSHPVPANIRYWAGTLQATWRVARAAQDHAGLDRAVTALRAAMDDQLATLGLPAEAGLLDGRAGIRLVQDTTARTASPAVDWDACLLLAA